ncbi:MAG: hypothetical protein GY731_09870, partial [Gammaproteobacteria bacterium]|nr:hypothetical protein [Gammaproteobacteria bacterium]
MPVLAVEVNRSFAQLRHTLHTYSAKRRGDFEPAAVTGAVNYSGDYFADSDDAVYYALGVDVPLPWELGLSLHVGHQYIDNNTNFGTPDYIDWSIGLDRSYSGFDFGLTYSDTNLSKRECFGGGNTCDGTFVFSVAK